MSPRQPAWGSGAAPSHSVVSASQGRSGPAHKFPWAAVGCVVPTLPAGRRRTVPPGSPAGVLSYTTGSNRAPTPRPQCAPPTRSWTCVR